MVPLWQSDSIQKNLIQESSIYDVAFKLVPRQITWLWPEKKELINAIAIGPKNAKYWWIFGRNFVPL